MKKSVLNLMLPVLVLSLALSARAADWPHFLGPDYDNKTRETGWNLEAIGEIEKVWSCDVGSAYSSFSYVGGRLYTCGDAEGKQAVYCLDALKGDVIWKQPFEDMYKDRRGDGARATPTVHDGKVYIIGAMGRFACLDASDGKELWAHQLGRRPTWGHSGSVLIHGDLAIVPAGLRDGAIRAYAKNTGALKWSVGSDRTSYAMPFPFVLGGRKYVATRMANRIYFVDPDEGREVLTIPWKCGVNATAPVYEDGLMFISSAYKKGSAVYRIFAKGDGLGYEEVWSDKKLECRFSPLVLHEGHLYGQIENELACIELKTGAVKWRRRKGHRNWGNVVMADGHLLVLTSVGELQLAKPSPYGYSPIKTQRVLRGRCWTAPVLASGYLYVRNQTEVRCFDMRR